MNSKNIIIRIVLILGLLCMNMLSAFAVEEVTVNSAQVENPTGAEQDAVYIRDIEIQGTNSIKPDYILKKLQLHRGDEYSRDIVQNDLKAIYQMGFFTDKLKAVPVKNTDGSVTLKIFVQENIPVTDFTIEGNTVISTEEILDLLTPMEGHPQNIAKINEAIEQIQELYASRGYILARVETLYDDPDGTINIKLNEGVINRILISGNEKTKDYVVERNILTEPGTVYNENQIKEDLVRLYATQAFKDVNRDIEPSETDPEKYDVTINVEEQRTASISIGGGLDSATGIFGSAGIADNNFRGLNQRVGLNVLAGTGVVLNDSTIQDHMNLQAELSFFEPYFLNADNSFMGKLFFRDFGSYQIPLAIERRFGAEATVSHKVKVNKNLTTTMAVGFENVDVSEGDAWKMSNLYRSAGLDPSLRRRQLEGGSFINLSPGVVYDTRDAVMNPRHGVLANARFDEEIGIDGLEKTHGKLTGMIKKYMPVGKKSSFSLMARAGGFIHNGDEVPEVMAFRLGGPYTVRGYKMSGVGTGTGFAMGSAELNTPIPFLDKLKISFLDNVRLSFFVDAGKVFGTTLTDQIYDRPMQAISAGVGLKVYIPGIGPLSVDYGIPLTNPGPNGSKNGYFTFGVGDMMY